MSSAPPAKKKKTGSSDAEKVWSVGFLGCGNMARAIVEGMLRSGKVIASNIIASATSESSVNYKKMKELGATVTTFNKDVVMNSDMIVIAVKPHLVLGVLAEMQAMYKEFHSSVPGSTRPLPAAAAAPPSPKNLRPLLVSVAASVTIASIEEKTEISWNIAGSPISGHMPVIRCLPNLGSATCSGVTPYTRGKFCNDVDLVPFLQLFSLVGHCEEVPERLMDPLSALSGSGIAFISLMLEGLADGGVLVGIPRPLSQKMAALAMMSVAKMVLEGKKNPAELKDGCCSPGGTSIRGILAMEKAGVRGGIIEAVKVTTERAEELRPK